MTEKKKQLMNEMSRLLQEKDKPIYLPVADYLIRLGYLPEKRRVQGFSLAFKHETSKKLIARFDMRQIKRQTPFPLLSVKFFGVREVPAKYTQALVRELASGMYQGSPLSKTNKNECLRHECACTGGRLGYYHQYPDGTEVLRCGAYPIPIYDLTPADVEEMKNVIGLQHEYFQSIL